MPPAQTHTAGLCLFIPPRKKHHGLSITYSNMGMEKRGFKTIHLQGWGGSGDGGIEMGGGWGWGVSSRHEMDQGGERERNEERGRMKERWKLTIASWMLQTDKQTGLLLEVMASNMIKHVNRSHSLNTAIAELECLHQKHILYIHMGSDTNTQASNHGTDKHRQTHAYLRQTDSDRHTQLPFDHNTSASITASDVPPSPSLCS